MIMQLMSTGCRTLQIINLFYSKAIIKIIEAIESRPTPREPEKYRQSLEKHMLTHKGFPRPSKLYDKTQSLNRREAGLFLVGDHCVEINCSSTCITHWAESGSEFESTED